MDFTLRKYRSLLSALKEKGYEFLSFEEYFHRGGTRVCILRHDVDKMPGNALKMSAVEKKSGIRASYHVRYPSSKSYRQTIRKLASEGHEIAYHYEELDVISKARFGYGKRLFLRSNFRNSHEDAEYSECLEQAVELFESRLKVMRGFYPLKVISMHGSPLAPFDNRDIWKIRNYRDFGLECEVYFDIDYSRVLYLTDTGGRWDGNLYNMRDRPAGTHQTKPGPDFRSEFSFSSTLAIIDALRENSLPPELIINTHPQRWNDNILVWLSEKIWQNLKNILKKALIKNRYNSG